ncbi:hypothetical protein MMC12_005355, partial [Toensbergia leucococca]|nr:hypothetical protein [Toensbergia leucococca]
MPALVRKVAIIAAVDGLVLLPLSHRNQREIASFQINYATHDIISLGLALPEYLSSDSLEAHGITSLMPVLANQGLLTVASTSYLISITRRQQIAQIRGKPIFVVTGVVIIPLSSQSDARNAIQEAKESLKKEFGDAGLGASPD